MKNLRWIGAGAFALSTIAGCTTEPSTGLGFGALLLRTLLVLLAVSLLAVASLRWLAGRGFGNGARDDAKLDVLERIPVGPRQAVIAVRAADRVFIVGVSGQRFDALGDVALQHWQQSGSAADARARGTLEHSTSAEHTSGQRADSVVSPNDAHASRRTFSDVLAAAERSASPRVEPTEAELAGSPAQPIDQPEVSA